MQHNCTIHTETIDGNSTTSEYPSGCSTKPDAVIKRTYRTCVDNICSTEESTKRRDYNRKDYSSDNPESYGWDNNPESDFWDNNPGSNFWDSAIQPPFRPSPVIPPPPSIPVSETIIRTNSKSLEQLKKEYIEKGTNCIIAGSVFLGLCFIAFGLWLWKEIPIFAMVSMLFFIIGFSCLIAGILYRVKNESYAQRKIDGNKSTVQTNFTETTSISG